MTNENESKRSKTSQKIDSRKFQFLQKIDSISIQFLRWVSWQFVRHHRSGLEATRGWKRRTSPKFSKPFFFVTSPKFSQNSMRISEGMVEFYAFFTISTSNFDSFQFVLFTFSDNFQIDILVCFQIECQWSVSKRGAESMLNFLQVEIVTHSWDHSLCMLRHCFTPLSVKYLEFPPFPRQAQRFIHEFAKFLTTFGGSQPQELCGFPWLSQLLCEKKMNKKNENEEY